MSKVITFSRTFPSYHPKKGQPTYFVEKFLKGRPTPIEEEWLPIVSLFEQLPLALDIWWALDRKLHTIRSGKRWRVGDMFSPRVWSGKPYKSKQIIISPDTQIKKIWDLRMDIEGCFYLNEKEFDVTSGFFSENDGLSSAELLDWFPYGKKEFNGQVICWDENVNY
jgi:hypothetical protein